MKKGIFIVFILLLLFISCEKSDKVQNQDIQIIGFDATKCYCCWGWVIKIKEDTIKTDHFPNDFQIGDKFPIHVNLELGKKVRSCTNYGRYDYYEIKWIRLAK
jgi:hypothetical protein